MTAFHSLVETLGTDDVNPGEGLRWAARLAGGLVVGAGTLLVSASAFIGHAITRPRRLRVIAAREVDETVEVVTFLTDDGLTLHGWYLCPARPATPRDAIIICHGFAMNRNELLDLARSLRDRGHAVLLFDFRAHGDSEGERSTIGLREADDIGAAIGFLKGRDELVGLPIGVAGISMGGAAALLAAARHGDIAAVAADSSFATLHDVAANGLKLIYGIPRTPLTSLVVRFGELFSRSRIRYNRPIDAVAEIAPRPVLIVHAVEDRLIPVADAEELYAAAGEPKELWLVPGIDHANAFLHDPAEYTRRIDAFFRKWLWAAAPAPAELAAAK